MGGGGETRKETRDTEMSSLRGREPQDRTEATGDKERVRETEIVIERDRCIKIGNDRERREEGGEGGKNGGVEQRDRDYKI